MTHAAAHSSVFSIDPHGRRHIAHPTFVVSIAAIAAAASFSNNMSSPVEQNL